ncbi:MAG TPA: Fic family protein [Ideonella sp.]|uniref:Fic/DOC family protein n=1 Tax=Ideonella sp. TaxID=1929293 RepID=UPI002CC5F140|nr:Fic family protein [Ideonella sp.]HSI47651.1 Fic family protein [Ideonella sp.]
MSRYDSHGNEAEFQPGSDDQVLRNLVGIDSPDDMDELELGLLGQLYEDVLVQQLPDRRLLVEDLKTWHRLWLGNVYAWAGQERSVNLSKGDFLFAPAVQVQRLLAVFEKDCLSRWTPCRDLAEEALIEAIAVTHVEFILIHPFREGNGRLSRLLADVMAAQGGHGPLDYSSWEAEKAAYIGAIHAGLAGNYGPMCRCVAAAMGSSEADLNGPA